MNIKAAHSNLIHNEIVPMSVSNPKVINALTHIDRAQFVPKDYQGLAYADTEIPLGYDQIMLEPGLIAKIVQNLHISGKDNILEIGTGSGYMSAVLGTLAKKVTSIEIVKELAVAAQDKLKDLGFDNIQVKSGNGLTYKMDNSYDIIVLTGSLPSVPEYLLDLLSSNGKLFVITGFKPIMQAKIITKNNKYKENIIFETVIPKLLEVPGVSKFRF